ncbi:putative AT DNA binding protein [Aspergillus affinis]|uniref:putative AT DNA binding protein n=1 Tax=Aspergillus affinis TaxID=1070780 RepID=UPI0022FEC5B8|nr:uncharacterized protein KD926_002120 [Aspergillus affinis]KAI9036302.1 hypothetical protein KD926_002120 [Aspergillus affinis]
MYSNSSASSPDILGTPGDAEYLISSPIKPFTGRQSAMSPANFKLLQTPRTGSRPRASFTPGGRSAHSIRFDDVLLPASPSMKLDGGQMSFSPDKAQTDGNVSPWRIRVTLEATQDDDEMAVDSPRKRLRPVTTTTTKIPLKGEEASVEETPRRRRGRPRKSDLVEQDATPIPGSPGHTPGPVGASGQKRKRGRPRKNTPVWDATEAATGSQEARMPGIQEAQENQRIQELHDDQDEPMEDVHDTQEARATQDFQEDRRVQEIDQAAPFYEPQRSFSPLNLAGDADSDDDDLPDVQDFGAPLEKPTPTQGYLGGAHENRSSPRVRFEQTFDTPHVDSPDEPYMANGSGHWGSTPSKMPSPSRERNIISPDNTLHAGRTPMPPRTYPTPTSSSLVDEEKRDSAPSASSDNPTTNGNLRPDESHHTEDPTDERREFDSIIESEGFSMVSLDTLPSAKQHGLEGKEDSNIGKSALRRVWNQDTIGSLQRRTSRDESGSVSSSRTRQSSKEPRKTRHSRQPSNRPGSSSAKPKPVKSPSPIVSPPARSAPKSTIRKGPLSRLARIIRLGVALEGTMRHAYESPDVMATPHIPNTGDQVSDMDASRKRMEIIFSNFNPTMHHELRGALRFGHELARRKRQAELETIRPRKATKSPMTDTPREKGRDAARASATPLQQANSNRRTKSPSTMMKRRMEEWQREREAISREIQMANTSQVIVIGSDDSGPGIDEQDTREPSVEQEQEPEFNRAAPFETLADPADDYSDDDDQYNDYQQRQNSDEYQDEYQDQDQYHDQYHEDLDQYPDLHEEQHQHAHHLQSPAQGLDVMDDQYYRDLDLGEDKDDYEHYRELDLGPDSNDGDDDEGYHRDLDLGPEQNEGQYQDPDQDQYEDPHDEQHLHRYQHESPIQDQGVDDVQYPDLAHRDENEEQYQHDDSEEDEDEDIWQQEAHNQSAHSHRSPVTYDQQNDMAAGKESSPWENGLNDTPGEQGESSPDYWITKQDKVPFLGQSRVRQLREQNVDLSGILRAEYTPRRSRYYHGTSSPMSAAKSRPLQSSPSTKASQHDDVRGYVPENNLQSDGFLASSPRLSDDEAFQVDPTTRHENAWQLALAQRDQQRNEDIPSAAVTEQQSAHETHGITPERAQPTSAEIPASSLFRRIASLTPRWLKAPIRGSPKRPSPPVREESSEDEEPEPEQEEVDEVDAAAAAAAAATEDKEAEDEEESEEDEELPVEPARFDDEVHGETGNNQEMEETPRPLHQVARKGLDRHSSATPLPGQMLDHERASPDVGTTGETYERQLPLAVSGYFSDDHYTFLRRLYRLAKRYPERFPFHSSAERAGIVGDWIWTSDGVHGVPITERQFAIIDRFVQELAKADLQAGGTGQVGWTEADVHRRLISIIIGEEIRKERKAGMQGQWSTESSRNRATAARSWR